MTEPQTDRELHHPDSGQVSLDMVGDNDTRERIPPVDTRYSLLTNRNNLLEILSSGLIKPASLYTKYYPDFGAAYREALPLLARNPSSNLVERMAEGDPGSFPVLLDIDLAGMTGSAQAVLGDYRTEQVEIPLREDAVCLLVDGVLPATRVNAVHFRSEQELQEHVARIYENIRADAVPLRVSPERFRGRRMNVKRMLTSLNRTQQATDILQPEHLARADAVAGALLVVAALTERDFRLPLDALARPLELLRTTTDLPAVLEKLEEYPAVDRRLQAIVVALLDDQNTPKLEALAAHLPAGNGSPQHQEHSVADLLAMVAARTLATMSPDDYFAEATLESIREGLEEVMATSGNGTTLSRYRPILESVGYVVDNSMDLEDFPAAEVPVATGLLHFLLQSDPTRLMNRALGDRDGNPEALAAAVVFSGTLYGRAMIPVEFRPDVGFERHVDELLVQYLNRDGKGLALPVQGSLIAETRTLDNGLQEDVLRANEDVLIRRVRSSSAPVATVKDEKDGPVEDSAALQEQVEPVESTAPGIEDEVFRRLSTSDLAGGPEKEAAIRLCRAAGWNDCVITTIKLEHPGRLVTDIPRSEVRIEGFASFAVGIRADRFRKELSADTWAALPESIKRDVEAALGFS